MGERERGKWKKKRSRGGRHRVKNTRKQAEKEEEIDGKDIDETEKRENGGWSGGLTSWEERERAK